VLFPTLQSNPNSRCSPAGEVRRERLPRLRVAFPGVNAGQAA
jgi:hypothetical protein